MKVVILAGGFGTRISEESHLKPKPMIELQDKPILWHIMKIYSSQGFNDFVICLGYKGYVIKEYFSNYFLHASDVTFDLTKNRNEITIHNNNAEPWRVTLVETGLNTMTGGRLKKVIPYLNNERFMLTYGDGVSDIDIKALLDFHQKQKKIATVTAIQPLGRYGALAIDENDKVFGFVEKPKGDVGNWVNGGFFVFEPEFLKYLENDSTILEKEPLEKLAKDGGLSAYRHNGFWQCMDTMRDKTYLEDMVVKKTAPWMKW